MAGTEVRDRLKGPTTGAGADPVAVTRSWLDAAAALPDAGLSVWTSVIGGVPIRFRCTDPSLAGLYRQRLVDSDRAAGQAPVLQLDLLETARLGWRDSAEAWSGGASAAVAAQLADEQLAALLPDADGSFPRVCFDPRTGRGVMLVGTTHDLPPWTSGAPFALLLHLAFAWRGWRVLHAAAIGADSTGALLAGPGGSGKSGTTLAAIAHGLDTVGDDYLLLAPGFRPLAWPLYRVAKQDPAGLARLGRDDLVGHPVNWMGKVELDLRATFPDRLAQALELRLILLPEVAGAPRTEISPVSAAYAFSAMAPSALTQLPGARLAGFRFLTRLTRTLPAYRLRLSADPAEIAKVLHRLLET